MIFNKSVLPSSTGMLLKKNYNLRVVVFFALLTWLFQFLWQRSNLIQPHSLRFAPDFLPLMQTGLHCLVFLGIEYLVMTFCLYLLIPTWDQMLAVTARFMLAQTIALLMAANKMIPANNYVIDTLLGIGILYVAIENLYVSKYKGQRSAISFILGFLFGVHMYHKLLAAGLYENTGVADILAIDTGMMGGEFLLFLVAFQFVGRLLAGNTKFRFMVTIPFSILALGLAGYWTYHQIFQS